MSFVPEVIPFVRPKDASHLMIFNLPLHTTESELFAICVRYGPIFSCRVIQKFRDNVVKQEEQQPREQITSEYLDPLDQQPTVVTADIPVDQSVEQVLSQVYAHVHYYSINDANTCARSLVADWMDATKVRVVHYQRPAFRTESEGYQLATWKCLDLMNSMVGATQWSCSIRWVRPYDVEQDSAIIAGQSDTFATEEEMASYRWACQANNFKCSYACEVEFLVPSSIDPKYDVHVASNGVSHARNNSERENCKKRAITNAYRFLFAHLAIIRTNPTSVHVRTFEMNGED